MILDELIIWKTATKKQMRGMDTIYLHSSAVRSPEDERKKTGFLHAWTVEHGKKQTLIHAYFSGSSNCLNFYAAKPGCGVFM